MTLSDFNARNDAAAKFWDIEQEVTGASLIGIKKRAGWLLPGEKKLSGLGA